MKGITNRREAAIMKPFDPVPLLFLAFLAPLADAQETAKVVRPEVVGARIADPFQVRKRLGVSPEYDSTTSLANVKIAILDFGFEGFDPARKQLPPETVVVEHYPDEFIRTNELGDPAFKKGFMPGNNHGRLMAQIVWATANFAADGPRFYLLNANGPTMFRRAVRYAVQEKVDVVLFCGSFEGIGNFDGKGPINAIVDEAVRAGIIWINAAGNYGRRTYNGPVTVGTDGYLRFADGRDFLRIRNNLDENTLTVTLNWNSYGDAEDAGTVKDLDLYLQDPNGNLIGKSDAVQIPGGTTGENQSKNPRERVVLADLPSSKGRDYLVRIRAASRNWDANDRIRLHVTALKDAPFLDPVTRLETNPVDFIDASGVGEIFPPADHPRVITVGDASAGSGVGPTADFRVKPDFLIEESQAVFSNGESSFGSSNAAAYFAGVVCLLKANAPGLTTSHLLKMATSRARTATAPPRTTTTVGTASKASRRVSPAARAAAQANDTSSSRTAGTPIALSRARQTAVGSVIAAIERYDPTMLVWQGTDGGLVAGVNRSPADLATLFPRFPQDRARIADEFEFFLAIDKSTGTARIVDYFRRKGVNDPAPWQAIGGKASDWVEVRKHSTNSSPISTRLSSLLANRVWRTPTKVELRTAVGFNETANAPPKAGGSNWPPPTPRPSVK
jgi:hypothetical protein